MRDAGARPSSLALVLLLVAVKGLALAIDPAVRLYLGDSAAYLAGGLSDDGLPRDRSFVYSLVLRALVTPTGYLPTLLVWQAAAGIVTALLLRLILVRHLGVARRWATAAAIAFALEPAQLFYERMVLAETFALLAFAAFAAAGGEYLRSGRPRWLPASAALGLAAGALRLNYLPVVLVLSLGLPFLRVADRRNRMLARTLVAHGVAAVVVTAILHTAYRHTVAATFDVPPSYLASGGFMRLALVVPLVRADHFVRAGLPSDLGDGLAYELGDPDARTLHAWQPGGLAHAIVARGRDLEPVARALSRMAIEDDPFGLVRLGVHTMGNYFRWPLARATLADDLGHRPYPPELIRSLRDDWGYDARGVAFRMTPVSRYFAMSAWWLVACLCLAAPLAVLHALASRRTPAASPALLCALLSVGLMATHLLFVNIALYRYLQPLPFLVILNGLPVLARVR